jgi:hypothetical protein
LQVLRLGVVVGQRVGLDLARVGRDTRMARSCVLGVWLTAVRSAEAGYQGKRRILRLGTRAELVVLHNVMALRALFSVLGLHVN